jgi:serine/threonine protein kinase
VFVGQVKMDAVILRCLEKDPDKRFQTVQEIIAVLKSCLHDEPCVGDRRAKALCLVGRKAGMTTAPWKNRILTQAPFNRDLAGYNLRNRCRLRGNQCG